MKRKRNCRTRVEKKENKEYNIKEQNKLEYKENQRTEKAKRTEEAITEKENNKRTRLEKAKRTKEPDLRKRKRKRIKERTKEKEN